MENSKWLEEPFHFEVSEELATYLHFTLAINHNLQRKGAFYCHDFRKPALWHREQPRACLFLTSTFSK